MYFKDQSQGKNGPRGLNESKAKVTTEANENVGDGDGCEDEDVERITTLRLKVVHVNPV